jgi:hypothetical protein
MVLCGIRTEIFASIRKLAVLGHEHARVCVAPSALISVLYDFPDLHSRAYSLPFLRGSGLKGRKLMAPAEARVGVSGGNERRRQNLISGSGGELAAFAGFMLHVNRHGAPTFCR